MDLQALELIAEDRYAKAATPAEIAEWAAALNAVRLVTALARRTGDWYACLQCPLAFETAAEADAHYWSRHRGAIRVG
jgi:hypothetical protein